MDPSYITIGDLFYKRQPFEIPKYQRAFAWEGENIDDFVEDLQKCWKLRVDSTSNSHFFGGIVSIQLTRSGTGPGHIYEVVDGQQRLATFLLMLSLLRDTYGQVRKQAEQAGKEDVAELAELSEKRIDDDYILFRGRKKMDERSPRLLLSKADRDFFTRVLKGWTVEETRESHRRIINAKNKLQKNLVDSVLKSEGTLEGQLEALQKLEEAAVDDCYVIHLVTTERREAYQLFQVLNDRGMSLSEGDLLRATTLELLESFPSVQKPAEKRWDDLLRDEYRVTETFMRSYYASHKGKRPGKRTLFDDFRTEFFPERCTDEKTARSVGSRISNMKSEMEVFRKIFEPTWPYASSSVTAWERQRLDMLLWALKHTLCLPLLLAAYLLDERKFSQVVQLLERFVFRYVIVCRRHVGKLTELYMREATKIRKSPKTYNISDLRKQLVELEKNEAKNELFSTLLIEAIRYKTGSNSYLRYFLTTVDEFSKWCDKNGKGDPKCDKSQLYDLRQVTIEHIYPQKVAEEKDEDEELEKAKHLIGNLSFWHQGDNTAAANLSFGKKKKQYRESTVRMNRELNRLQQWTAVECEKRQKQLVDRALKIFSISS